LLLLDGKHILPIFKHITARKTLTNDRAGGKANKETKKWLEKLPLEAFY
jgi:hypothetical protein